MNDNLLQSLDYGVFDPVDHPPSGMKIYIFNNLWICDSNIIWLVQAMQDWMTEQYWTPHGPAICTGPTTLAGRQLVSLNEHEMPTAEPVLADPDPSG